ncbi:MAG: class I SAM-dependent methyltransferase [bacterium]
MKVNSHKTENIFKRFCDARWAWNLIQGPVYNHLVFRALSGFYEYFSGEVKTPENSKILDVGSGPGFLTCMLAEKNPSSEVTGIDYSRTEVSYAWRHRNRTGVMNCSFFQADAMNIPFAGSTFNTVVSMASLKHWPDARRGFEEIRRVLAPGGKALIAEADREAGGREVSRFAGKFSAWYAFPPFIKWYLKEIVAGKSYTRAEAAAFASAAGFDKIKTEKITGLPFFMLKLYK